MPSLPQLEAFLLLAKVRNGAIVSRRLGISDSNVRKLIKTLEANLGFDLLYHWENRGRSPYTLTPAGKAFLPYAKQLIEVYRTGRRKAIQAENEMEEAS